MKFEDKKFIIYGSDRLKEDFEYIFDGLHIERCINENNYKEVINQDLSDTIILICEKNSKQIINEFEDLNLKYKKDFFIAKDFFCNLISPFPDIQNRELVIWGTGKASQLFIKAINCEFDYYVDSDVTKKDSIINGKPVRYSKDIHDWKNKYIIVASSFYYQIKGELVKLGLKEKEDFIYYEKLSEFPQMFEKFVYATEEKDMYCSYPFGTCDICFHGNVCICCFMREYPLGNIEDNDIKQIWNSIYAKMIRRSIINKTFCYCNNECNLWRGASKKVLESDVPYHVNTEIDYTCNLMCTQCRNGMKIAEGKEYEEIDFIADRIIEEILPNVNSFALAGNGEVFFSKAYKKILKSDNLEKLNLFGILSNGILFNEENWNILKKHNLKNINLAFSIDAATKKTYEKLRKGGNFDILIRNLKFAASLKENKEINCIKLYFVIQRENFKEMPDFIKLAKSINADYVGFSRIRNCVGYSEEEFSKISMFDENDKPLKELEEILLNPIFNDSIVDLSIDVIH